MDEETVHIKEPLTQESDVVNALAERQNLERQIQQYANEYHDASQLLEKCITLCETTRSALMIFIQRYQELETRNGDKH